MAQYNVALVKGDGIGPDIIDETVSVLNEIGNIYGHTFNFVEAVAGGCAIERYGEPLPRSAVETCLNADSVLLGAVGGPKWDGLPGHLRPEQALLGLRSKLGLYANIRPATLFPPLQAACPLKDEVVHRGVDLVVVRELTGGLYFGEKGRRPTENMGQAAYDTMYYTEKEIERIGRIAFSLARSRNKRLTSVDKANVLESSRLWREVMHRLRDEFPDVEYSDMYVDNASMQLIRDPSQFDVIVTENTFGDILSDEASMLTGSIGMLPSASLGDNSRGLYEPIHGSAPDIAGRDLANPLAAILSAAMMLRLSFDLAEEADCIERAVMKVLSDGIRTADICGENDKVVGTKAMGDAVRKRLAK
ncbi:MAG: 3-isopropylmalate dehydrogenase [Eubacteriales bacterium]|jgi:3-isopropylmalate dehydrogenase